MKLLTDIHNHLGMGVLILLALAVLVAIIKWTGKRSYTTLDKYLYMISSSIVEVQVLLGLIIYIMGSKWQGFSQMDVDVVRFFTIEHPFGMLIAVALTSIGRGRSKKASDDTKKHKRVAIFYGIALVLILVSIPWDFRF